MTAGRRHLKNQLKANFSGKFDISKFGLKFLTNQNLREFNLPKKSSFGYLSLLS